MQLCDSSANQARGGSPKAIQSLWGYYPTSAFVIQEFASQIHQAEVEISQEQGEERVYMQPGGKNGRL